jgi:hypothetical protein
MVEGADVTVEVAAFPEIYVRVMMWLGDEQLPPHVAILFDKNLAGILAFEDIVVLLGVMVSIVTGR